MSSILPAAPSNADAPGFARQFRTLARDEAGMVRKAQRVELAQAQGSDPYRFVLSTENKDLDGDVVVQAGLELVSDRIPAQIDHSGSIRDLIGHWRNVTTAGKQTTATLALVDKGISRTADLVRALLDSGVRMAASIGFVPIKTDYIREPDTDAGRITGFKFSRSRLVEASVVVVPANPEALNLAKSLLKSPAERAALEQLLVRAAPGIPAQEPGRRPRASLESSTMPTIAESIQAAEATLTQTRDALEVAQARLAGDPNVDAVQTEVETLLERIGRESRSLKLLKDSEAALAARAAPAGQEGRSTGGGTGGGAGGSAALVRRRPKSSPDLLVRAAVLAMESHIKRCTVEECLERRYPGDEGVMAVAGLTTKAAQNPAMTNVPGWAQELTRESYAAFMELLAPESVVPRIPMMTLQFDGSSAINVPMRATRTPNLAAAFRAEGAPIRVGAASVTSKKLTPKSLGVIGTFTNELFERSTPNIETLIRQFMIEDTAIMLDAYFLSATPPIAGVSPGGIQNAVGAGNTRPSTGRTVSAIYADLQVMVAAMAAANLLKKPVWIMNPVNSAALAFALTASGLPAFPGVTISGGTLMGFPVIASTTVPTTTVFLVDGSGLNFAGGVPQFLGTDVATIHEEDTTPLPIVDGSATPVTAHPVRSLFQTNSSALRALWEIDWNIMIPGSVQVLTAVAWGT